MKSDKEVIAMMAAVIHATNCNAKHWVGTVGAAEGYSAAQCHCAAEAKKLFLQIKGTEG